MLDDWKVTRGAVLCSRCQVEFRKGSLFFSALREQEQDFVRQDFCPSCWEQAKAPDFFSFWKTLGQTEERRPKISTDVVFDMFSQLANADNEDKKELRFVLALYLTRRKALKLVGFSREGERELLQFRRPRRRETLPVENPELTEKQVSAAGERLKELFQAEL